jgi:preprotein translocase subunit SecA
MMRGPRQMTLSRGPVGGGAGAAPPIGGGSSSGGAGGEVAKAGRNDPCPCGSGKKYKKCHGA